MNKEIKAKWIAALRSGKYKKGQGSLHTKILNEDRFCCLGVLCDLHRKACRDNKYHWMEVDYDRRNGSFSYEEESVTLPVLVQKWAGLTNKEGCVKIKPQRDFCNIDTLAELNDRGDATFEQIANVIEKQL